MHRQDETQRRDDNGWKRYEKGKDSKKMSYVITGSDMMMLNVEIMITERVNLGGWLIQNVISIITIIFTYQ